MSKIIYLADGQEVLIDDQDYDFVRRWPWHGVRGYAGRLTSGAHGAIRNCVLMHRAIAERAGFNISGLEVDHINRNRLDNQRSNLRPATRSQNQHNSNRRKDNTSGLAGIHLAERQAKWIVRIQVDGTRKFVGSFDTLVEAKAARDAAREKLL